MASQSSKKALETHLQKYLRNSGQEYELPANIRKTDSQELEHFT